MQRVENTCSFINIFPEDASSWESWLLLAFSQRDTLTVGFGFAAAANPFCAPWTPRPGTGRRPPSGPSSGRCRRFFGPGNRARGTTYNGTCPELSRNSPAPAPLATRAPARREASAAANERRYRAATRRRQRTAGRSAPHPLEDARGRQGALGLPDALARVGLAGDAYGTTYECRWPATPYKRCTAHQPCCIGVNPTLLSLGAIRLSDSRP